MQGLLSKRVKNTAKAPEGNKNLTNQIHPPVKKEPGQTEVTEQRML